MSWVTIIWSMIGAVCLTLAAIYGLVWYRNRQAWAHLFFALTSASTTGLAFTELWLMRAQTPGEFLAALTWGHVPLFFWLVSVTWFVRFYLGAGRLWLAWTITAVRVVVAVANVALGQNLNFRHITSLRHIDFLGESVTVVGGVPNPFTPLAQLGALLILIFVADASVSAWRRGDRRKALRVGGSVEFFVIASLSTASAVIWGNLQAPILFSVFYMALVVVMGYELSRDLLRASQLVHELQASEAGLRESEARMSLAVDVADFGIWIRNLSRNEIWASEKWRELFGFASSDNMDFDAILNRVHPDDRQALHDAHAMAIAGANGDRYQGEYRLTLQDGTTRWIASQGRVERDAAGQPVLIRGASRDITASKHAEVALHNLSGRLLSAQEEERRRIARELHDNLSQQMALLAIEIDQVALRPGELPTDVASSAIQMRRLAAEISTEIHNLSHRLHSSKLEMLGLVAALQSHCRELFAQGIHVHFYTENVPRPLPPDVQLCLFRVAQEGLTNVVKHSRAREAHVTLRAGGDALLLSIADAGIGFDDLAAPIQEGLGLASMRERLRLIDSDFTIRSEPGQGTTITARVPLSRLGGTSAAETAGVA